MNERDPTIGDVLTAVTALGARIGQVETRLGEVEMGLNTKLIEVRAAVMDRIDRLQDTMTEQKDDMGVLLELLATNQKIAERGLSEARSALDVHSQTSSAMTALGRQIRQLRDRVEKLEGHRGESI
jgi:hypothetical protein